MSRTAVTVAVVALLATAGCAGFLAGDGGGSGTVSFYVSDQPGAIDQFESVNVTVTEVAFHPANASENDSWVTRDVDDRTVDLTELQGENATLLGNVSVPEGDYDKVFVEVSSVEGTLDNGESADVKLPSERLQLSSSFTVESNETLSFVYDVTVIERGNSGYVLHPQAGQSGPDQPINRTD